MATTIWLSEAYLLAGRDADGSAAAQRALDLARQPKERGQEAWALRLLGEIAHKLIHRRLGKRRSIIVKLSPSLKNSACVRSSRIATLVWANCIRRIGIC